MQRQCGKYESPPTIVRGMPFHPKHGGLCANPKLPKDRQDTARRGRGCFDGHVWLETDKYIYDVVFVLWLTARSDLGTSHPCLHNQSAIKSWCDKIFPKITIPIAVLGKTLERSRSDFEIHRVASSICDKILIQKTLKIRIRFLRTRLGVVKIHIRMNVSKLLKCMN